MNNAWNKISCISLLSLFFLGGSVMQTQAETVDVLVIGGGASGTAASVESARLGAKTLLVEESSWLGGMLTSAGVSAIDGNYRLPSGFWGEFKDSLVSYYGSLAALKTGWVSNVLFEPSVGNNILQSITRKEKNLSIYFNSTIQNVTNQDGLWTASIQTPSGVVMVKSKVLIDGTELGDVAKMCGVKYDIGMESRYTTGESIAPEQANGIIQDLTFAATLKDYHRDVSIPRPADYDSTLYLCCCVNSLCNTETPAWSISKMISYGQLPNGKYMINWPIKGNDYYLNVIEMTPAERVEALKKAKSITMGFLYFIQKELGLKTLGLADDEYPTADRLPFIPYYRESRRIHGLVRFTENHMTNPYTQPEKLYRTNIAVGDYPVDHHHKRYTGSEVLPDLSFHSVPSFGLPLGTLIPKEVEGLIVAEKSISVSNITNGATRLQPVSLQIGHAAGTLAALSVLQNKKISEVAVRDVQNALLTSGEYLLPYLDIPKSNPAFLSLQRIGATGIMKGVGKTVGWSNETWFRADTILRISELSGLNEVYPYMGIDGNNLNELSGYGALTIIENIAKKENLSTATDINSLVSNLLKTLSYSKSSIVVNGVVNLNNKITRLEMAVLIDKLLDPFNNKPVNIYGAYSEPANNQTVTTNWQLSNAGGNPPTLPDGVTSLLDNATRKFAVGTMNGHDRVFVISRTGGTPKILIYNASDGKYVDSLRTGGIIDIAHAKFAVNDGDVTEDGKLLVCNMVMPNTLGFKVYKWDDETSAPTVVIDYLFGSGRYGDNITITGNYTTGTAKVYAVNRVAGPTKILCWSMMADPANPGKFIFDQTPKELFEVTANNSNPTVGIKPDGSLYYKDGGQQITEFSSLGIATPYQSTANVVSLQGHSIRYVDAEGSDEYIAYYKYRSNLTTQPAAQERADLLKVPNGDLSAAELIASTPILGEVVNINGSGEVFARRAGNNIELFVLSATNGFGKYTVSNVFTTTEVEKTVSDHIRIFYQANTIFVEGVNPTEIEVYNILGQKIKSVINKKQIEISGHHGIFIVQVKLDKNLVKTSKICIQ